MTVKSKHKVDIYIETIHFKILQLKVFTPLFEVDFELNRFSLCFEMLFASICLDLGNNEQRQWHFSVSLFHEYIAFPFITFLSAAGLLCSQLNNPTHLYKL